MKAILFQIDGSMPNLALMRIAQHHRNLGHEVELRITNKPERQLFDSGDEIIYASAIFERSRSAIEQVLEQYPNAHVGGTGWNNDIRLEDIGITTQGVDYSIYPNYPHSIGFTQRGCRLRCPFCVVPEKEGSVTEEKTINEIWRGEPYPKEIYLLDNDFFGQANWRDRIREIKEGDFKVCFGQGINARLLDAESAQAIASIKYRDTRFGTARIYTAWDNKKDEVVFLKGLNYLIDAGITPDSIMVYMLIGYWEGETVEDWNYRRSMLRELGVRPYPMTFIRNKESIGFQRWVIGAYDKRVSWDKWVEASYEPRKLNAYSS